MLKTKNLSLGYKNNIILNNINIHIPENKITILVGSNGCGKSTLLKSMARLLKPQTGSILIGDDHLFNVNTKDIAKKLSILTQTPQSPDDLTIFNLVKQGRYPHQTWLKQWSKEDEIAVNEALNKTGLYEIKDKKLCDLSGGQRQRAWIALTLAQESEIILLDEPTNHLDMKYKIEVLELLNNLNKKDKRTIVMVLHDINLACRYADNIIAIKDGSVYDHGSPKDIINEKLIMDVFDVKCKILDCPVFATPTCIAY